ncbi:MAG: hypothetical protein LBD09_03175 [Treponema sp.]|jgi:hypothetical protein|nr:hypothetical protein [Treponema sp.]
MGINLSGIARGTGGAGKPAPEAGTGLSAPVRGSEKPGTAKSAVPAKPGPASAASPAAETAKRPLPVHNAPANNALHNLLTALKLPPDNLSRSIAAFARFFSLPLEPKLLASFRRAALSFPASPTGESGKGNPGTGSVRSVRGEAAALAAAAAADKGAALTEKALAEYAAAIDPALNNGMEERRRVPDREGSGQNGDSPGGENGETGGNGGNENSEGGTAAEGGPGTADSGSPEPEDLRRRALAALEKNSPLDLLNRIPGKRGRWVVLPFTYCRGPLVFDITLRIAAEQTGTERLCADISVSPRKPAEPADRESRGERRWNITLEKPKLPADAPYGGAVLAVSGGGTPGTADIQRLGAELAAALGLPPEKVHIRDGDSFFADSRDDHLRSVDEAV